jgi:hypothetical protein
LSRLIKVPANRSSTTNPIQTTAAGVNTNTASPSGQNKRGPQLLLRAVPFTSIARKEKTADLSTALRFGRDQNSVATWFVAFLGNRKSPPPRIVISTGA